MTRVARIRKLLDHVSVVIAVLSRRINAWLSTSSHVLPSP
jgi:hypothetical protein